MTGQRSNSPGGLEKEISDHNPVLQRKYKEMDNNQALYSKDYEKLYQPESVEFTSISLGLNYNILAVD